MTTQELYNWKLLLSQLEVVLECTTGLSTLNEQQLKNFEANTRLILPQGYKEFCQIIGAGRFGQNMFYIEFPDPKKVEEQLTSNRIILEACKDGFPWSSDIQELLDSAYLFGGGNSHILFIFDMRTYVEQEQSYDIYGISCQTGFYYYFGKNFFQFIQDFCIGEKAKELPKLQVKIPPDCDKKNSLYRKKTFVPFPVSEEDFSLFEDV